MNTPKKPKQSKEPVYEPRGYGVVRDYTESIAMAIILAFLFRMFLLEAFVIPTGSMAPTLHGRHMDVICPQCEYQYQTGASEENDGSSTVLKTDCPLCRYRMELDKEQFPNQRSFQGDRILVNKFSYAFSEPKRWQVIVFKFPGNAKQNYIKRLVGLPGEVIKIKGGDIYVVPPEEPDKTRFQIVRKSPRKLLAMLQLVHDTKYVAKDLERMGWPDRWQPWPPKGEADAAGWTAMTNRKGYQISAENEQACFLRYQHLVVTDPDLRNEQEPDGPKPKLIKDYYAYNNGGGSRNIAPGSGDDWVGDLAAEYDVEVEGSSGELLLDLVEGGHHFACTIDIATGMATLSRTDRYGIKEVFTDDQGARSGNPAGKTKITGPGSYRLRFSNVDNELRLWVNNRLIAFEGPTTYESEAFLQVEGDWATDPGDKAPLAIGTRSLAVQVKRLRVLRDVYYEPERWPAQKTMKREPQIIVVGQDEFLPMGDNSPGSSDGRVWPGKPLWRETTNSYWPGRLREPPEYWRMIVAKVQPDDWDSFGYPVRLGPVSADELPKRFQWMFDQWDENEDGLISKEETRLKHTVHRSLLIGQATFVYWPHSWRWGKLPLIPNFKQMRLIK